jgi:predicted SnoaL-like aldol condensation-catalyzing enzyme
LKRIFIFLFVLIRLIRGKNLFGFGLSRLGKEAFSMKMDQIEIAIRLVIEFNEAFNRHDVAGMMQLMSDDCVFENTSPAPDGTRYSGKEVVTQFWQTFFQESPQAHIEIEEIFGFRAQCVMRWRYTWVDGAGREGHVRGVDIFHIKNDLIYEKLSYVKG